MASSLVSCILKKIENTLIFFLFAKLLFFYFSFKYSLYRMKAKSIKDFHNNSDSGDNDRR